MSFDQAFQKTVGVEGRYSNDPNDPGGETAFGLTVGFARAHGYTGPMLAMTADNARNLYRRGIWDLLRLDLIDAISPTIALEVFDSAVNLGTGVPIPWLQQWLNALNRQGKDYPDQAVDGHFGQVGANALKQFLARRGAKGEKVLLAALNAEQAVYYRQVVTKRDRSEDYLFGWMANRVVT
jgi:lysozyme family protein